MPDADVQFNPAESIPEASARMFALTASRDAGTRGPRRSLHALADALRVEVDSNDVVAVVGGQIAEELGVPWRQNREFVDYQVTLRGMNALLQAASENLLRLSQAHSLASNDALDQALRAMPWFRPATRKQEVVDRLTSLAGVPQYTLGNGGKEYASTFPDIARRFAPHLLDARRTKHEWAEALAHELGVPWSPAAVSTEGTVTKEGLNLLLAGVERRAQVSSSGWATAAQEGQALVDALREELPPHWDARDSIEWMRESGSTQWRNTEWFGFFFEEKARMILNERWTTPPIGGPQVKFGATTFDYASPQRVWDAKAHTAQSLPVPPDGSRPENKPKTAWLNHAEAVLSCVEQQGLGFLVVDGRAGMDHSGEFRQWHTEQGLASGKPLSGYTSSTGKSRVRKTWWTPLVLRAVWIENTASLDAGIAAGWIRTKRQPDWGVQKRKRNPKFEARPSDAGDWIVASHTWPTPDHR